MKQVIRAATAIKRSFMPLFGAWPSLQIHVLRGSASASRWWSEILGEWHRCWLRKSNGAEFLKAATVLTVVVGAWAIVLQPHKLYPLLAILDTFKPHRALKLARLVSHWLQMMVRCCIFVVLAYLFFCCFALLCATPPKVRNITVEWFATCELHLVLVKFKPALLVFIYKCAWKIRETMTRMRKFTMEWFD